MTQSKTDWTRWLNTLLISIVGVYIWADRTEMHTDIRSLADDRASQKEKVEQLRKEVDNLNQKVFFQGASSVPIKKTNYNIPSIVATLPEEEFDVKKYLVVM